jgi:hypothetical protein
MAFIGNTVQTQGFTPAIDYFNGNGVTVTFTLSRPIASVAQVIVAIDNVIQNPNDAFTVAGNAITFSSAPLSGTNNIWVEYTSLITTYQAISQDPTVIGDIRATGGYLAEGDFGNSFVDGAILDYVTGNGRITVGDLDGLIIYNGGTAARSSLLALTANGALGVGTSPSYGTAGQFLKSNGAGSAPTWASLSVYQINYLVVAGGGGGGAAGIANNYEGGGGGGAGGYISGSVISTGSTVYSFTVGAGGAGGINASRSANGSNSTGFSTTAIGGGAGAGRNNAGTDFAANSGGSGGGGSNYGSQQSGAAGTSGQGNSGGNAAAVASNNGGNGGGGGSGSSGSNSSGETGGNGGSGTSNSITGSSISYAGGGGGGGGTAGSGQGGGGNGGNGGGVSGGNGTANRGGGGGGCVAGSSPSNGGNGGSGVVILSLPTVNYSGVTTGSPTVTTSGANTIITFTSSGSYTA